MKKTISDSLKFIVQAFFVAILAVGIIGFQGIGGKSGIGGKAGIGGSSSASPAFVANANGYDVSGNQLSSISTSSTLNVTSGQLLHVACYVYSNPGTMTVTDSGSTNTFSAGPAGVIGPFDGLSHGYIETFYASNTVAESSDTITCHFSGGIAAYVGVMVNQASGVATSSPVDTYASNLSQGFTSITSGSFTTTNSTDIVIASAAVNVSSASFAAGTNFTLRNNSSNEGADETWITSSIETGVMASISYGIATDAGIIVIAYK